MTTFYIRAAGCILVAALLVRLTAAGIWQARLPPGKAFVFPDSESYWYLARAIARGEPYQFGDADHRVFRTPGYPLLLAGLFRLAGEDPPVFWARALSAVLGSATVGGVMLLTRRLFDEQAALWAGVLAAIYPGAVAMSVLVLAEAPLSLMVLLQLICWSRACQESRPAAYRAYALLAGLCAAAASLMRPSWLLFSPAAALLALGIGGDRRRHLQIGALLLVALTAGMLPWWVRNDRVTGRFVPTTLEVGASLYDGWNPQATGASDMRFVAAFRTQLRQEDAGRLATGRDTFELRLDRRLRSAALEWAGAHPGRVGQLAGIKFLRMWNVWPNEPSLRGRLVRIVVLIGYLPLLACGLVGAWRFAGRGWPYVLCLLPSVYLTVVHMVFVGSLRYREPAMLCLIVLAAGLVSPWVAPGRASPRGDQSVAS